MNFRFLVYSIILAIAGYGTWAAFNDGDKLVGAVSRIGLSGLLFLCLLSLVNYSLRYLRWYLMLRRVGDKPAFGDGMLCYWAGFALTTTPGKAGEAIRCLYFKNRHGVDNAHSFAALLADRLSDLLSAMLMATGALFYFADFRWIGWGLLGLSAAILLAVFRTALLLACARWLETRSPARLPCSRRRPASSTAMLSCSRCKAILKTPAASWPCTVAWSEPIAARKESRCTWPTAVLCSHRWWSMRPA